MSAPYVGNIADENVKYTGVLPNKFLGLDGMNSWRLTAYFPSGAVVCQGKFFGGISDERRLVGAARAAAGARAAAAADRRAAAATAEAAVLAGLAAGRGRGHDRVRRAFAAAEQGRAGERPAEGTARRHVRNIHPR